MATRSLLRENQNDAHQVGEAPFQLCRLHRLSLLPILMLFGDVEQLSGELKNRIVQLTGMSANAQYLTWNQVPETVKFETETLLSQIYGLTNTPRISFDSLKETGNTVLGVAFDYVFMSTHLNVESSR